MTKKGNIVFENCRKKNRKKRMSISTLILSSVIIGVIIVGFKNEESTMSMNDEKQIFYNENNIPQAVEDIESSLVSLEITQNDGQRMILSGVVYNDDGFIVTSNRGMENIKAIDVTFKDDEVVSGVKVGEDKFNEIAIVKVDKPGLLPFQRGECNLNVGDKIYQITPSNKLHEVSDVVEYVVNTKEKRKLYRNSIIKNIDISDIIYKEDYEGSILINESGDVIGLSTYIKSDDSGDEYQLKVVSMDEIIDVVDRIKISMDKKRSLFGIIGERLVDNKDKYIGIYIHEIHKNSNADRAGLRPTDILLEINGYKIETLNDIDDIIKNVDLSGAIKCKVRRYNLIEDLIVEVNEKSAGLTEAP